jgi:hypothetical protein
MEDIDGAIVHLTESILPLPLSLLQRGPFTLDALYCLATALLSRSEVTKQSEDVVVATKLLFYLRDQPQEIPSISRHRATELLIGSLALQVDLEAGNVMQSIREIAILSRELFTVETSDIDTTRLINLIWELVRSNSRLDVPDQPLDELIECLRAAMKRRPDLTQARAALAMSLICRYYRTGRNDDYEEAMSILDEITSSRNSQDESFYQKFATGLAAFLAKFRSEAHWNPEYLEEAIYRTRAAFLTSSSHTESYSHLAWDPEDAAKQRFRYFGSIEGVEEPPATGPSVSSPVPETPESSQTRYEEMQSQIPAINGSDIMKIDEAIKKSRSIAASSNGEPILTLFGEMLFHAFRHTKKIKYLNESISTRRKMLESPVFSQAERLRILFILAKSLLARSHSFPGYRTQDLDEGLELATQCVNDAHLNLPDRLRLAYQWTYCARHTRHPSVSTAYETALLIDARHPALCTNFAATALHSRRAQGHS